MNFQAAVTALVAVYLARGRPLGWLEEYADDVPVSLLAETGGPGDDIQLHYRNGSIAEIQIKRGLETGDRLWDSLLKLAEAIHAGTIGYGILIVSPDSSRTITQDLARDIKRLADGRTDGLSELAKVFQSKLATAALPARSTCDRLRIVTIHALDADDASIRAARAELEHLCIDKTQIGHAWNALYRDASELIELRGRRTASTVTRILCSTGVDMLTDTQDTPATVLAKLTNWVLSANASFSIFGVAQPLLIEKAWIPIKAVACDSATPEGGGLAEALDRYHAWDRHQASHDSIVADAETIGRFIRHAVVVAGPGMGKSTLLTKLARCYAEDGYPVLRVSLLALATRMRHQGSGFAEGLFALGLDGSNLELSAVKSAGLTDWVLLCDGLDECGSDQEAVAQGILKFVAGHPACRVIVTTRPVGYRSALLRTWRHYNLAPLEAGAAAGHVAALIRSIVPEDHPTHHSAHGLAEAQLKKSRASDLVVRSPLLLGIVASLIVRGSTLGRTKAQLYSKIFELIDEVPNSRIASASASSSVLRRVLDILGWDLLANPLSLVTATVERCAEQVAQDMRLAPLQARETVETCLRYWQDVGMLERIQHAGEETITFIHKTFGEFAAARYLKSMLPETQLRAVAAILDQDTWSEVLSFAGSLGLATLIGAKMLERRDSVAAELRTIGRALALVSDADEPPEPEIRRQIIDRAFIYVRSQRRWWSYDVGKALVPVSERFPSEVGCLATSLLDDEQLWTRIVAWACVVAAGPDYYNLERLKDALTTLPHLVERGIRPTLAGGVALGGGDRELVERFALRATQEILERYPPDVADAILPNALNAISLGSVGFYIEISALLREKGKAYKVDPFSISTSYQRGTLASDDAYAEALKTSYEKVLGALVDPATEVSDEGNCAEPEALLHVSAFFRLIAFWEAPAYDIWAWSKTYDEEATRQVLRAIASVSPIEHDRLVHDIRVLLKILRTTPTEDFRLFDWLANVDVPALEWERAKSLDLDSAKLETALYHGSGWLIDLATNLLSQVSDKETLKAAVTRLFTSGTQLTLWGAANLATELDPQGAIEIAYERLRRPLTPGCEHLFELLHYLNAPLDTNLLSALHHGLITGTPKTAIAAARLALEFAMPGTDRLHDLLHEAYTHWQKHEQSYPTSGGTVPNSPREHLLSALLKIKPPTHQQLFEYAADVRHDVREIGTTALLKRLTDSEVAREIFVDAARNETISASLLIRALREKTPFNPSQIEQLCELLTSTNPKFRYAALNVLDSAYLARDKAESLARAMTADPDLEIRDAAFRLLD